MKKHTYDYIHSFIKSKNYTLLSKEYKGAHSKLQIQCDKGHFFEMVWNNFRNGQRCPVCYGGGKLSYKFVKQYVEQRGLDILLSKKYKNCMKKYKFQCKKDGNVYWMTWNQYYNRGQRCPVCGGVAVPSYEQVKEHVEQRNLDILLSKEYKGALKKHKFQCKKDKHVYEMTWSHYQQGSRCPVCYHNSTSSKAEQEIQEYIAKIYSGTIVNNDRNTIINENTGYYLELDVYLPEINKAIEYNGVYWHSLPQRKTNDKIKKQQCKNKNIDLLIINEENYMNNKDKCLKKIEKFIHTI